MKKRMKRILNWLSNNKKYIIVFTIYLVITSVAIWFHEDWEDEMQAWTTARDCDIVELIGRMKIEGHFLPWYLILMPFAKLGFPYQTMNIISWIITSISAWLMLTKLPCKFYKRALFIFTLPMLYVYPVIARCYCLLPLATILAIIFYKERFKRPMFYLLSIVLIANVHIYCFSFALLLGVEFLIEFLNKKKELTKKQIRNIYISILGVIVLIILSFMPLLGCDIDKETSISGTRFNPSFSSIRYLIGIPTEFLDMAFPVIPRWIVGIPIIILVIWSYIYNKRVFFEFFFVVIWWFFIYDSIFGTILPARATMIMFVGLFIISTRENDKTVRIPKYVENFLDYVFLAILIYGLIKSGNKILSLSIIIFCTMKFIPYGLKRYGIEKKWLKVEKFLLKMNILILSICSALLGLKYVITDINRPYTEATSTANYVNSKLPSRSIILTRRASIIYTSLVPRIKDAMLYDMDFNEFYTYTKDLGSQHELSDITEKKWFDYCQILGHNVYYLESFSLEYEKFINALRNKEDDVSTATKQGIIEEIYDSHKAEHNPWPENLPYPVNEHYRLYKVNCSQIQVWED